METLLLLKVSIQPCFLAVLEYYIGDLSYTSRLFRGYLYSLLYDAVLLVHYAIVLVHVPDVACYERLELHLEHGQGLVALFLRVAFEFQAFCLGKDTVGHRLRHGVVATEVVERCVARLELLAVLVYIMQGGVDDERTGCNLTRGTKTSGMMPPPP